MATVTMHGGIYLSPTNDVAKMTQQWVRDGTAVIGTGLTSPDLAVGDNVGALIEFVEQAGNSAGLTTEHRTTVQAAAFPAVIEFNSSALNFYSSSDASLPFGPSASLANTATIAFRFKIDVTGQLSEYICNGGHFIINTNSSGSLLRFRASGVIDTTITLPYGEWISLLISTDGAAQFSGAKTCIIYGKIGAASWGEIASSTTSHSVLEPPTDVFGNTTLNPGGPIFDVEHYIWAHDTAMEPSTNYVVFFNADGTVKDLGTDGTAGGLLPAPKLYMKSSDFVGSGPTLNNSGTQGSVDLGGTPLNVVFP